MSKTNSAKSNGNSFAGRFGAIMAMAGMSIGMGNVWRFPYMVGKFGGGSFLIAYITCMFLVAMPLALMEAGLGKGLGKGLVQAFQVSLKNKKAGKVIGGIFSVGYFTMNFFYFVVVSASLYFAYACISGQWNTVEPTMIYDGLMSNTMLMSVISVALVLLVTFVLVKGVSNGIEAASKVMIPLMFVFLIVAVFFAIFSIDGIAAGYNWFIQPNAAVLLNPDVWVAAMGQALFSIGVGPGCVLVYGSHLKRTSDVTLTMTTVCMLDFCVGVITGMAIIPACVAMNLDPASGSELIFIVLPKLFSLLPGGALIGALVFIAIFFAGLTSAIAQTEVAVASFSDGFNWTRKKAAIFFGSINVVAAVIAVYRVSFYDFWNNFSGNYVFIVSAGIGAIVYGYVFGVDRIRTQFMNPSSAIKLGPWFTKLVKFVAIPIMLVIMANSLFPFLSAAETPDTRIIGDTLSMTSIISLVLLVVVMFGGTVLLVIKCMNTSDVTSEEVDAYLKETNTIEEEFDLS